MKRFIIFFILLIAGISSLIFVYIRNRQGNDPNLQSVVDLGADIGRNLHRVGMTATRVETDEEITLGRKLARNIAQQGILLDSPELQAYIQKVGEKVSEGRASKDIPYTFQIIHSNQENAFALPGGYIFITSRMLTFLQSEAELAFILGHEVGHVDQHHCIEYYQYQIKLDKMGLDELGHIISGLQYLSSLSYSEQQEHEADFQGIRLMAMANYNTLSSVSIFERKQAIADDVKGKSGPASFKTPVEEFVDILEGAFKSYFETHPQLNKRIYEMKRFIKANHYDIQKKGYDIGEDRYYRKVKQDLRKYNSSVLRKD